MVMPRFGERVSSFAKCRYKKDKTRSCSVTWTLCPWVSSTHLLICLRGMKSVFGIRRDELFMRTRAFCLQGLFKNEVQPTADESACNFEIGCTEVAFPWPSPSSLSPDFTFNGGRANDAGPTDVPFTKPQYAFASFIIARCKATLVSSTRKIFHQRERYHLRPQQNAEA